MRILVVFMLIWVVFAAGCVQQTTEKQTVKIGVILPLTGPSSDAGNYIKSGLLLAENEIINNTKRKYSITMIFEDSQFKSDVAVSTIQKLINLDNVQFFIGAAGSSETLAIAPIAEQNKVILITPASQATKVTTAGDYIFRTQINTKQETEFFSKFISNRISNQTLDLIAWNTDYGISYIDDYSKFYRNLSGNIGLVQKFDTAETDFRTFLLKIKDSDANNLLMVGNRKHVGTILKQAKELGLNITFFASSPAEGKELTDVAGNAADGLIYPYPYDSESNDSVQQQFQKKYQQIYGTRSEMYGATGYDTVYILSNCFEKVGIDVENVKQCLYDTKNYPGASGTITFDENGDVSKPFIVKTVRNGTFVRYEG